MAGSRSFQIDPEDVGPNVRILAVHGEADRFATDAVTEAVQSARDDGRGTIIDLNHTSYLDSSMLAALVAESELGRRSALPVVILCEASRLRRSLELKGLQTILTLADSREHALELVER
jgi:anti-anti-sigma factor